MTDPGHTVSHTTVHVDVTGPVAVTDHAYTTVDVNELLLTDYPGGDRAITARGLPILAGDQRGRREQNIGWYATGPDDHTATIPPEIRTIVEDVKPGWWPVMPGLNQQARDTLAAAGVTRAEWIHTHFGPDATQWCGDACGCPDDRCAGYHHDIKDDCGCLAARLADLPERHPTPTAAGPAHPEGPDAR